MRSLGDMVLQTTGTHPPTYPGLLGVEEPPHRCQILIKFVFAVILLEVLCHGMGIQLQFAILSDGGQLRVEHRPHRQPEYQTTTAMPQAIKRQLFPSFRIHSLPCTFSQHQLLFSSHFPNVFIPPPTPSWSLPPPFPPSLLSIHFHSHSTPHTLPVPLQSIPSPAFFLPALGSLPLPPQSPTSSLQLLPTTSYSVTPSHPRWDRYHNIMIPEPTL